MILYTLIGLGVAYLTLWGLAAYLWFTMRGYQAEVKDLRAQNERYAIALSHQYPVPPRQSSGVGAYPAEPNELQPSTAYFTRRSGWSK